MLTEEIIIGVGLVFIILIMALIMNPPEALVKRFYHGKSKRPSGNDGNSNS
jgi:Na+-transporting methylmalonyl-CoA/oxaloacetate decarboxylase gamma subunit